MKRLLNILLLGALYTISCTKEDLDLSPPELEFIEVTPMPTQDLICGEIDDAVFHLMSGEQLNFEVLIKDNQALSQFKIDIHNNFDCHGHGGSSTPGFTVPSITNQTEDWSLLETQDLSGTQETVVRILDVPENVTAGNYHFQLQVIDESGNDIPFANFYSLKILNSNDIEPPSIVAELPNADFSISKGEEVRFKGMVSDAISLSSGGNGVLFLSYTDLSSGNAFTTDAVFPFEASIVNEYPFDFNFSVPLTIPSGDYLFTLRAQDGVRNVATPVSFNVRVNN